MTTKKAQPKASRKTEVLRRPGTLGRKPMFPDEAKVVAVLRAESEYHKSRGRSDRRDTCTLHNLQIAVESHPDLFGPNLRHGKDGPVNRPYSPAAIKQAVYRLVKKHDIWLSRNGK